MVPFCQGRKNVVFINVGRKEVDATRYQAKDNAHLLWYVESDLNAKTMKL